MKYFVSMLAIASALAVTSPAFAGDTQADCEAAGGTFQGLFTGCFFADCAGLREESEAAAMESIAPPVREARSWSRAGRTWAVLPCNARRCSMSRPQRSAE